MTAVESLRSLQALIRRVAKHLWLTNTNSNRQLWRCSSCLNDTGTSTNSSLPSAHVPASHSVLTDIFRPRCVCQSSGVMPPSYLLETKPEIGAEPEAAHITPSAAIPVEPIKPKEISCSSQLPEPKLLERTEVPDTPSQRSSQFENHIPKKSSGHLPNANSSQPYHHAHEDDGALTVDASDHIQQRTPSTALCLTCRKQTALARVGDKRVQWYVESYLKQGKSNLCIVPVVAPDHGLW
jgi:hypothetical protein